MGLFHKRKKAQGKNTLGFGVKNQSSQNELQSFGMPNFDKSSNDIKNMMMDKNFSNDMMDSFKNGKLSPDIFKNFMTAPQTEIEKLNSINVNVKENTKDNIDVEIKIAAKSGKSKFESSFSIANHGSSAGRSQLLSNLKQMIRMQGLAKFEDEIINAVKKKI